MAPRTAAVAAAVLALTITGAARGNAPAPYVRTAAAGAPFVLGRTPLEVEREELSFDCGLRGARIECAFVATYHVRNPTAERQEVLGAFYGVAADRVTVTAGGADARHDLTPEQLAACDRAVRELAPSSESRVPAAARTGFIVGVAASATTDVVFAGRVAPFAINDRSPGSEFTLSPILTRHPWLSTDEREDTDFDFEYLVWPIRSWAGAPRLEVTVRHPAGWGFDAGEFAGGRGWSRATSGGTAVRTIQVDARAEPRLSMRFTLAGTRLLHGGPVLGVGPRLDAPGGRVRVAYELAYPNWLIYSLAGEASFAGRFTAVPAIEVATPDIIVLIPSLAVGAGVPISSGGGAGLAVGARLQFTVAFPILSLQIPVDVYPSMSGSTVQTALVVQASM